MKECAVPGCQTPTDSGLLMCRPHWFSLPQQVRNDVARTWRAWRRSKGDIDTYREYLHARSVALEVVTV